MKTTQALLFVVLLLGMTSCGGFWGGSSGPSFNAPLEPVYADLESLLDIRNLPEQMIVEGEDILWFQDLFFMEESEKGIHVFKINEGSDPEYLTFIQALGVNTFTVTEDFLYIRSSSLLITVNVSDIWNVQLVGYSNLFQESIVPPDHNGYFECVDLALGEVIGWVESSKSNFECHTL